MVTYTQALSKASSWENHFPISLHPGRMSASSQLRWSNHNLCTSSRRVGVKVCLSSERLAIVIGVEWNSRTKVLLPKFFCNWGLPIGFVRRFGVNIRALASITTGLTVASLWKSPVEIAYIDDRMSDLWKCHLWQLFTLLRTRSLIMECCISINTKPGLSFDIILEVLQLPSITPSNPETAESSIFSQSKQPST